MELLNQTIQLKENLHELREIFEKSEPPKDHRDKVFFTHVRERTSPIYELLALWEENALSFVKQRIINVHPHQVASTRENMELLLMHSYYVDARRKRYMELYKSVLYIFDQIIDELTPRASL